MICTLASDSWSIAYSTAEKKKKKKKKNLFVKFYKNNSDNKKDTLTGCQGGYTPINAGRL